MQKIKVDVVSDVVCPWCYIGKRRLERAMEILKDKFEFEITYWPFELNPQMPMEGQNQKEYLTAKFGSESQYDKLTQHVTNIANEEGLHFDYSKQTISPNTRDAHRLIWLAKQEGVQPQVKEALMNAYFVKGENLAKKETLIAIVAEAGLNKEKSETMLQSDEGIAEVAYLEQLNHQRGISGVPFYIVNDKYGISGAQPTSAFINAFNDIHEKIRSNE